MAFVYVLYSKFLDTYYIGSCVDLEERLNEHLSKKYTNSFTAKADDWSLYFSIADLGYQQARNVEGHIKKMKSKKYIENLKLYKDISETLIQKYK